MNAIYESRSIDIDQSTWQKCPKCDVRVKISAHTYCRAERVAQITR